LQNPVDVPVWSMFSGKDTFTGAMADAVALEEAVDVLCAFLDVGTVFDLEDRVAGEALLLRLTDDLVHAQRQGKPLVLVLRSSLDAHQDALVRKLRATALAAGVACFDSVDRAVAAIGGARFLARSGKTWAANSS
jgi:hypothetical protein